MGVKLWDCSGRLIARLEGTERLGFNDRCWFETDGRLIVVTLGPALALFDRGGKRIVTLHGHEGRINSVTLNRSGQRLLTASDDGTARLWSINGELLATFGGHAGPVRSAIFTPDEHSVLTAGEDGTARHHFVDAEGLVAAAAWRVGRGLTKAEIEQYQVPEPLRFSLEEQLRLRKSDASVDLT